MMRPTAVGGGRDGSDDIVVEGGRCEFGWREFGIFILGIWWRVLVPRSEHSDETAPPFFFGLHAT